MLRSGSSLWCLMPLSTIFQLYHGSQFLLVEESRVPGKNHPPVASHCQTVSHNVVLNGVRTHNFSADRH